MTEREKDDELHRARVHMQHVCRMYKLQHDEGRHFLHEHCQSELPWRKDCVEEVQEMTGAKLMSVRRGNCNLPSNEKPTVMVSNCPAIAFILRVFRLNKRHSEHLERNDHKSIEDLHEDFSCGIRLQHEWRRQHKYLLASVYVKNPQANFNDLENSVLPEESMTSCSIKYGMVTRESLWTRRRSRKTDSVRLSITTKCTCSKKCLLFNAGRGQARRT